MEILRELDTRLWGTLVCAGAPSGSSINQACEILSDCAVGRSMELAARHSF